MTPPLVWWQKMVSHTITHVISHPEDDTIVMYDRMHSPFVALQVCKFNVASTAVILSGTLPFKLWKVDWYSYLALSNDYRS
jgi:hypothetical protein